MKDFKWMTAFAAEKCAMCWGEIRQGDGFYYESTEKKPHCRDCGRAIKAKGYDNALKERNVFMRMARGAGGFGL